MIIAVVGSGGKTSYIMEQARQYFKQGKRVLVTTTTHMYAQEDTLFTNDAQEICTCLQENGYCMAGQRAGGAEELLPGGDIADGGGVVSETGRVKIRALSGDVFAQVSQCADVVLVEADGARGRPVKFPAEHEPVIPEGTDMIVVVMGYFAVGRRVEEACHRPQLVCAHLGVPLSHCLTEADLHKLVQEGYFEPLSQQYPQAKIILKKSL